MASRVPYGSLLPSRKSHQQTTSRKKKKIGQKINTVDTRIKTGITEKTNLIMRKIWMKENLPGKKNRVNMRIEEPQKSVAGSWRKKTRHFVWHTNNYVCHMLRAPISTFTVIFPGWHRQVSTSKNNGHLSTNSEQIHRKRCRLPMAVSISDSIRHVERSSLRNPLRCR
jgi:hypothetical protein